MLLLKFAPTTVGNHMRVTPGAVANYMAMRMAVETFYRHMGQWSSGDVQGDDPMDVSAFGDKGNQKGNSWQQKGNSWQQKGEDVSCENAGSPPETSSRRPLR